MISHCRYLKSFKKHRLNHALEKLHGKGGEVPKEVKYCNEDENNSKGVPDSNDQVSSSNETINVDEEESVSVVVKKENINEEAAGNV